MQRNKQYQDERLNRAAEELKSYCSLLREAEELTSKANEYRERYDYGLKARAFDGVYVTGGSVKDRMLETVIKWADLEVLANEKKLEAEQVLWEIRHKLGSLVTDEKNLMTLYYIKGYNNAQISRVMMYSVEWIRDLKKRALKNYAEVV